MEEIKPTKPRVSIITINLNNASGLEKTIISVQNQDFSDYEFIIVDGFSKDSSVSIIKKYSSIITYWSSEPDTGVYNAMNKGIMKSVGEYLYFLNSGDTFVSNQVLNEIFREDPTEDLLFGNLLVVINEQVIGKALGKMHLTFADIFNHTIKHQASFMKRTLFAKYGLFNENRKIVSDWEFFLKTVGLNNATYRYVNIYVSCFDNNGISNNNATLVRSERKQVIDENIPQMMRPDYEFLYNYKVYENIFYNKWTFFIVRLINKVIKR
jgi:glycosyltransferase involved in cell wall biosynthesis